MDEAAQHSVSRRSLLAGACGAASLLTMNGVARAHDVAPLAIPPGGGALPRYWSKAETLPLWAGRATPGGRFAAVDRPATLGPTFLSNVDEPYLKVFHPAKPNGGTILVVPGGAYSFVSIRNEGVDVARVMTRLGYTVFVLVYRLPGEGWTDRADVPLQDLQRAMRLIRSKASTYRLDPRRIAVLGFSAGGHLAASLMTDFAAPLHAPQDAVDLLDAAPLCGGLIYPVITVRSPYTHPLSAQLLLGDRPDDALLARRSPSDHVSNVTSPAFLVHAYDDPAVPWQNTQLFVTAMQAARRPVEVHYFEEGGHGFGIGPANGPAGQWPALFGAWLVRRGMPG